MAYDKIIVLHRRMDRCVDYVLNEEKTSLSNALAYAENTEKSHQLVTGINCQAATAYEEMQATKRRWDQRGGILGYHLVHSYAPGEVAPEQAHAAGVEFACRLLGDRYEAVVSTHTDRDHLHCHIVFNSVSFVDGKKYRSDYKSYFGDIRGTSNAVSREYGLSVIEPDGHGKHYAEWDAERRGKATITGLIKQDIDAAVAESFTFDSFLAVLRRRGYMVKYGANVKHTAIKPPGGERFFRLDTLKGAYTEAAIRERLAEVRSGDTPLMPPIPTPGRQRRYTIRQGNLHRRPRKLRGFRALYVYYLYFLGIRKPKQDQQLPPFTIRKEVVKLERYQQQFRLLQEYRIETDQQLTMLGEAIQAQIDTLVDQRRDLYREKRAGRVVDGAVEQINQELRQLRRKLKTCNQIESDIPHVREQVQLCREWQIKQEMQNHRKPHSATRLKRPMRSIEH